MTTQRMTRQQQLLNILDVANTPFSARITSSRKYPLQFLTEYANALLDGDTGKLLEYRHLVKRPKYKRDWEYFLATILDAYAKTCLVVPTAPKQCTSSTKAKSPAIVGKI